MWKYCFTHAKVAAGATGVLCRTSALRMVSVVRVRVSDRNEPVVDDEEPDTVTGRAVVEPCLLVRRFRLCTVLVPPRHGARAPDAAERARRIGGIGPVRPVGPPYRYDSGRPGFPGHS